MQISSLALLKVNWDVEKDYIEIFVPFVLECLRTDPRDSISTAQLQSKMSGEFGMEVPQDVLNTVLRRVVKKGYATKKSKAYIKNRRLLSEVNFASVRDHALRQTRALIEKLQFFIKNRYRVEIENEQAEKMLFGRLREYAELLPSDLQEEDEDDADQLDSPDFVVRSFILDLQRDPEGFGYLETVFMGLLLANTLYFPALGRIEKKFDNLEVYLDSNVILRALGLAGGGEQEPYQELLHLAVQAGARLRCFEHTVEEIRRVLDYVASVLRNKYMPVDGYNEILEHLMTRGETPTNVELLRSRLESRLEDLGIAVKEKPLHRRALGVDEQRLAKMFRAERTNPREPAIQHDVDSVAAVHRLRRGRKAVDIENCRALFVTTSHRLCDVSARFFDEHFGQTTAPHCMSSQAFTTIVWLKFPARAPELPMKRLIADCYAALSPSQPLWSRFVAEITELRNTSMISSDDYYYLRFAVPARNALVEITGGNAAALDAETIPAVLERARAAARAEVESELEAERTSKRLVETDLIREREAVSKLVAEAESARQETARLSQEVDAALRILKNNHEALESRLVWIGDLVGKVVAAVTLTGSVFFVCLVVLVPLISIAGPELQAKSLWTLAGVAAAIATALLTILNLSFGVTAQRVAQWLQRRVSDSVSRLLRRLLGVSRAS